MRGPRCPSLNVVKSTPTQVDEEADEEALPLVASSFADYSDQHFLLQ